MEIKKDLVCRRLTKTRSYQEKLRETKQWWKIFKKSIVLEMEK